MATSLSPAKTVRLTPLHPPQAIDVKVRDCNVVVISSVYSTPPWECGRNGHSGWLQELCQSLGSNVQVWQLSYNTRPDSPICYHLMDNAPALLEGLEEISANPLVPILLISHGLGGFILKEALGSIRPRFHLHSKLIGAIAGFYFIGCPHLKGTCDDPSNVVEHVLKCLNVPSHIIAGKRLIEICENNGLLKVCEEFDLLALSVPVLSTVEQKLHGRVHLWPRSKALNQSHNLYKIQGNDETFLEVSANPKEVVNPGLHKGVAQFLMQAVRKFREKDPVLASTVPGGDNDTFCSSSTPSIRVERSPTSSSSKTTTSTGSPKRKGTFHRTNPGVGSSRTFHLPVSSPLSRPGSTPPDHCDSGKDRDNMDRLQALFLQLSSMQALGASSSLQKNYHTDPFRLYISQERRIEQGNYVASVESQVVKSKTPKWGELPRLLPESLGGPRTSRTYTPSNLEPASNLDSYFLNIPWAPGKMLTLLDQFLETLKSQFDLIGTVSGASIEDLTRGFARVARHMGLVHPSENVDDVDAAERTKGWLARPVTSDQPDSWSKNDELHWLLIIVGVKDFRMLQDFWPGYTSGTVLVIPDESAHVFRYPISLEGGNPIRPFDLGAAILRQEEVSRHHYYDRDISPLIRRFSEYSAVVDRRTSWKVSRVALVITKLLRSRRNLHAQPGGSGIPV